MQSIESRLCLNTATIKKAPLERQIQLTAGAGFRRIGLWRDDIETATPRGFSWEQISATLQKHGLQVEELCFLGGWQDADEAGFARALQETRQLSRLSRALDCHLLITVPAAGRGFLSVGPERFRRICEVAAQYDQRVALEFPGTAAEVRDLRTAWELIADAGSENGGLVLDTFHFFLGGSKIEDLAKVPAEKIFLVHVSDAMDVPQEKLRTHHDYRTFPGRGTLDYRPLFQELSRRGYGGALSVEIWNQQLLRADAAEIARQAYDSLLQVGWLTSPEGPPGGDFPEGKRAWQAS